MKKLQQETPRHAVHAIHSNHSNLISSKGNFSATTVETSQPPRRERGADCAQTPNAQADRDSVRPICAVMLARIRIVRQLGTLPWLQQREDNHADEGPDELRDSGVDVQDPEVEAGELARGVVVVLLGYGALFETGSCGCCGREGRGEFERGAGR
jgi:hypothetical protein